MRNILTLIGGAFIVLSLLSYNTTDGRHTSEISRGFSTTVVLPLKQKAIIVTTNFKKISRLMRKGWIIENVDVIDRTNYHIEYYTLIKY
jgi:hypothetical protein